MGEDWLVAESGGSASNGDSVGASIWSALFFPSIFGKSECWSDTIDVRADPSGNCGKTPSFKGVWIFFAALELSSS